MSYVDIIITLLRLAGSLFSYFQQQKWIEEGEAKAVAKASAEILRKSGYAKQALAEAHAKSDTELDDLLRDFEPGAGDKPGER